MRLNVIYISLIFISISSILFGEGVITVSSGEEADVYINNELQTSLSPKIPCEITIKKPGKYLFEIRPKNSQVIHQEEVVISSVGDIKKSIVAFSKNPSNGGPTTPVGKAFTDNSPTIEINKDKGINKEPFDDTDQKIQGYKNSILNLRHGKRDRDDILGLSAAFKCVFSIPVFQALEKEGITAFNEKRYPAAEKYFRLLLSEIPDLPEINLYLGMALYNQGKYPESISAYQLALKLKPELNQTYYHLGNSLAAIGRYKESNEAYNMVGKQPANPKINEPPNKKPVRHTIESPPPVVESGIPKREHKEDRGKGNNAPSPLIIRAKELLVQNKSLEARKLLRTATNEDPTSFDAWFLLGSVALENSAYKEAKNAFSQALGINPTHKEAGRLYFKAHYYGAEYDIALKKLEAIAQEYPNNVGVQTNLARVYYDSAYKDKCLKLCQKLINRFPDDQSIKELMNKSK